MANTFPYYPKTYGQTDSTSAGLVAAEKSGSSWSDMLGLNADPYSPAQQSMNIWGSNTSPLESPSWENILGSFGSGIPTPPASQPTTPAETPTPPPPEPQRRYSGSPGGFGGGGGVPFNPIPSTYTGSQGGLILGAWGPSQAQLAEEARITAAGNAIGWGPELSLGYYRYMFQ